MTNRNKGECLYSPQDNYIVFDLETTGTNIYSCEIIEIGALKIRNGKIIDKFESFAKPLNPIPYYATMVNGITNAMVKNAPEIKSVLYDFLNFIQNDILIGHNINSFDLNIIYDHILNNFDVVISNNFVDTYHLAKRCLFDIDNHKLCTIANYFSINHSNAHRALDDCYTTFESYKMMKDLNQSCLISKRSSVLRKK